MWRRAAAIRPASARPGAVMAIAAAAHLWAAPSVSAATPVEESQPAAPLFEAAPNVAAPPPVPVEAARAAPGPAESSQLSQLFYQLQRLQQEVNLLRGAVEDQRHRLEQLGREQQERYQDLDRRIAAGPASGQPTPANPSAEALQAPATSTEEGAYRAAYALMDQRDYIAATQAMQRLIDDYPNGRYTPNAFYWLGEMQYRNGDLERARQALVQVINLYPDHNKTPAALYKAGVVYAALGDAARARSYFERTIRDHADSTAASLAKDSLAELP